MILFTQSTAVLHKYLNDELKILCYNFSLRLHRIPWEFPSFPCSEKSLSIPGLWPHHYSTITLKTQSRNLHKNFVKLTSTRDLHVWHSFLHSQVFLVEVWSHWIEHCSIPCQKLACKWQKLRGLTGRQRSYRSFLYINLHQNLTL